MFLVQLPRRGGKTTQLLDWMQEAPEGEVRVCVSHSAQEAMHLLRLAHEQGRGLESWQFISVGEARQTWQGFYPGRANRVVLGVDNAEIILSQILGQSVEAMTVTAD